MKKLFTIINRVQLNRIIALDRSKGNGGQCWWWRHSLRGWKLVLHTSPCRRMGAVGMRTYRGIAGFELVPPTESIAPVRPPSDELFLFSHTSYNLGEILPPPFNIVLLRRDRPVIEWLLWIR